MEFEVYKLVKLVASDNGEGYLFCSFAAGGYNKKFYEIGKMAASETPLFVYKDADMAQSVIRGSLPEYKILRGITTTKPRPVPTRGKFSYILPIHCSSYTYNEVRTFWDKWATATPLELESVYGPIMRVPAGTYLVYDFKPLEVVH